MLGSNAKNTSSLWGCRRRYARFDNNTNVSKGFSILDNYDR